MSLIKNLSQYKDILWLIYKYGNSDAFTELTSDVELPQILKERGQEKGKAEDLTHDLESLGPFYIKLGQILAAEADFLPEEYSKALEKLQDKATPMPYEDVEEIIKQELGKPPLKIFKKFHKRPLSAASLGQVHFAELSDGKKVAVKVQRKDIQKDILEQLEAFEKISSFLEENTEFGKKFHVIEKFEQLRTILLNELDYTKEATNLTTLHNNLKEFEHLIIPLPIDEFTTSRVLTMEYINAEKITELTPLEKIDINTDALAEELYKGFLKQILVDGFFQMDPHPGNVYLTFVEDEPCLALFDLGMVSRIPFQMQGQFMRCLMAVSEGREIELIKTMTLLGKRLTNFDEYFLRTKVADIVGTYHGQELSKVPIGKIILKLSRVAAESGLWLPIQFSTIGKALLSLDPVLKALAPDFKPTEKMQNYSSELFSRRLSKQFTYQSFYSSLLESLDFLQQLPGRLNEIFDLVSHGDYKLKLHLLDTESISKNFEKVANRITIGLILAALLISAALIMQVNTQFQLWGYPGLAIILFMISAVGSFFLIFQILWKDRRDKNKKG